jgi:hypothetical protein
MPMTPRKRRRCRISVLGQKHRFEHQSVSSGVDRQADDFRAAPEFAFGANNGQATQLPRQPRPPWNCVMLGAGGLGCFLTVSKYSSTCLSAGSDTQLNMPPTIRSSCGSISML